MKSYQFVYFDSSGARNTHTIKVLQITIITVIVLSVLLLLSLLVILLRTYSVHSEIAELRSNDLINNIERTTMAESINKLDQVVNILQNGDDFAGEVFKVPIIAKMFDYRDFTESSTKADHFRELLHAGNTKTYRAIPNLMRLIDMLNTESTKRLARYTKLMEYLEEQSIIFAHTPSIWPSTDRITSGFGFRRSPFTGVPSYHEGTDFGAPTGTPVRVTADGIVVFSGVRTGYGNLLTVDHGFGYITRYAHNSKLLVKSGDFVKKGDLIALSGATGRSSGAHLHYEVLFNGCPVNSANFLPR